MSTNGVNLKVDKNLATTVRAFVKENYKKDISETELNDLLKNFSKVNKDRTASGGKKIYSGGDKYLGGTGANFVVQKGQEIKLTEAEMRVIFGDYTPKDKPIEITKREESVKSIIQQDVPELKMTQNQIEKTHDIAVNAMKRDEDAKIKDRLVDGKKSEVAFKKEDGEKKYYAVNEDGSTGEELVVVHKGIKKEFETKSSYEDSIRNLLGLTADDDIPSDIKKEYTYVNGDRVAVYKKNGRSMDANGLREYANAVKIENKIKNDSQIQDLNKQLALLQKQFLASSTPNYRSGGLEFAQNEFNPNEVLKIEQKINSVKEEINNRKTELSKE